MLSGLENPVRDAKPITPPYVENNYRIVSKNYIYVNSLPSATLWIFLRIFDFSLL